MRYLVCVVAAATLAGCRDPLQPSEPDPASARAALQPPYVLTNLGTLGGFTQAVAVNDNDQIAGWGWTSGVGGTRHAFVWERGVLRDIGTVGGNASVATGINASGVVVGTAFFDAGASRVFTWHEGVVDDLGPGWGVAAAVINDLGQVAWTAPAGTGAHARLWDGATTRDLGTLGGAYSFARAINGAGQVTGTSYTSDGSVHAFLWSSGVMQDLGTLGGGSSSSWAVNDAGAVTGASYDANGRVHAFLWNGGMHDLGAPPDEEFSEGIAVNGRGEVAGHSSPYPDGDPARSAFRWRDGVMARLDVPAPSPLEIRAYGLNGHGVIVGMYRVPSQLHAVVWENDAVWDLGAQGEALAVNGRGDAVGWAGDAAALWRRGGGSPGAPTVASRR